MITQGKRLIKTAFPGIAETARDMRGIINGVRYAGRPGERYTCPICTYTGPFISYRAGDELYEIKSTQCPRCELYERHRLQHLVMSDLLARGDFSQKSVLHFAPEQRLVKLLRQHFGHHCTADLYEAGVDHRVDITAMQFDDASFDMVYASHVLEHVQDDQAALREIKRVLRPGGIAVLPVPIVSPRTIEYGAPNPHEFDHVRAVGVDYFDRYRAHFSRVEVYESKDYAPEFQLYTYERRDFYPTDLCPLRIPMEGARHSDFVPICYL